LIFVNNRTIVVYWDVIYVTGIFTQN
jgi:hypothetical protein